MPSFEKNPHFDCCIPLKGITNNMMSFAISANNVRQLTEAVASSNHPEKGMFLFATRAIRKGEVLTEGPKSNIMKRSFKDMVEFSQALEMVEDKKEYLMHCMPSGDGKIYEQSMESLYPFVNHSNNPNCKAHVERFTADHTRITARRNIARGEELTDNYNEAVGYEKHGGEQVMKDFLELCAKHGVEKRPSRLTSPPITVTIIE